MKVRIKRGALVAQDFMVCNWPDTRAGTAAAAPSGLTNLANRRPLAGRPVERVVGRKRLTGDRRWHGKM